MELFISFSDCWYTETTNFCMLIVYSGSLLIASRTFFWSILWVFLYMESYNLQTEFVLLLSHWLSSVSFCCLSAVDRTFSTMLNSIDKLSILVLFLSLGKKLSTFPTMILLCVFHKCLFMVHFIFFLWIYVIHLKF